MTKSGSVIRTALLIVSALGLAACGGGPQTSGGAATAPSSADWAAPPRPTAVSRAPDGGLVLQGAARPDTRVRVTVYGGEAYGAQADGEGAFRIVLPPGDGPRLLALSGDANDREVEGDGWIFVPADRPERAVVLRPGSPAMPVLGGTALDLIAVDYDAGGGATVSGTAPAGSAVAVLVDGAPAARGPADAAGRFALRLAERTPPGSHELLLSVGVVRLARTVTLAPPPAAGSLSISRQPEGWRVQWPTSGGGAQSTLVLTEGAGA
jgi:hypothetical protein